MYPKAVMPRALNAALIFVSLLGLGAAHAAEQTIHERMRLTISSTAVGAFPHGPMQEPSLVRNA